MLLEVLSSRSPATVLPRLLARFKRRRAELIAGPIRGELLGAEHLAERARSLAAGQRLAPAGWPRRGTPLLVRLNETRRILIEAHGRLAAAADRDLEVGPAGEWLLDNFHVVQQHIRDVHDNLPPDFYRELPVLDAGPLAGYPRIYELSITLISHTEGRIDSGNIDLFVRAFQGAAQLRIGELWALPAMLRLALIESVRRMALRTSSRLAQLEHADEWAGRIVAASEVGPRALSAAFEQFVVDHPPLTPAFVSRFLRQLHLTRGSFPPIVRLEQWIGEEALSAEAAATLATEHLAHTQMMMAHSITSLRTLAHMDWRPFVERHSALEQVLRDDPSGFYARMTFATRDRYRHVVEAIAKRTGQSEVDVAQRVVDLAHAGGNGHPPYDHVGYYLLDRGLPDLERATGYQPKTREAVHRWLLGHPDVVLGGGILVATVAALGAALWLAGPSARTAWLAVGLVALIPAWDIAVNVVNQLITTLLPPRALPKLDMATSTGIPEEFRTAVVVPTLFASVDAVHEALGDLEVQFLANREAHVHFALLGDFTDAPAESRADDAEIVAAAAEGVRALNDQYAPDTQDAFYLFHRPRRWNPRQRVWMGWERKRGKLAEFNRFLRGGESGFSVIIGDVATLRRVRYVITLDADTVLPPDAARELVGAMAHPLNRAVYDPARARVIRGYGILQPRVGVTLTSAHRSRFAAIHSGHPGVDPYTTAVSDVYQDLYGEGSYTGKGIYDVDIFEEATHGRFPENTLLSHDLIEGSYARAGLATDITLYDDYPARYLTYSRRKHRWIRGDWQLLGWLTPYVDGPQGRQRNRLSLLSRWKILDNLRRSTVEIALLVFLISGWTVLPGSPVRWTLLGLAAIGAPWIVSLLLGMLRPPLDRSWRAYYASIGRDAVTSAQQAALAIVFLPHQAWVSADAIVRTLWRMFVSKRFLLEWQTASMAELATADDARHVWRVMWPAVALVTGALVLALVNAARTGTASGLWQVAVVAVPLVAIWAASPAIAHFLSRPAAVLRPALADAYRADTMRYALLHWRYFDQFVTPATNGLAPDNFQEDPAPVVAARTSPTNIGLQLLATVSAYDLGFLAAEDMARRLELVFRSLERMRRYRGHLYNWYDVNTLEVLQPAYVSTVDSGNLAGHLIALRQACLSIADEPVFDTRVRGALMTALALAEERLRVLASSEFADDIRVRKALATATEQVLGAHALVARVDMASLALIAAPLERALEELARIPVAHGLIEPAEEWIAWSLRRIADHTAALDSLGAQPPGGREAGQGAPFRTLREMASTSRPAAELLARLEALAGRAHAHALEMDFRFLFDDARELFAIGYREGQAALDNSYYDLLASEARLASFVAIAKDEVPVEHWFRLGRTLTRAAGETALVSWSGSMFEYLMPALVMEWFPFTLLDQTYRGAVKRHISYGLERGVPWGASESAYNLRDRHLTYQYRAFGVPDLALKRGLGRDLVIAPYASALATMIAPKRALANLSALEKRGALGWYGFRDALDYTRPDGKGDYAVVGSYMAHHIGMSLVALTNALTERVWQRRFHADPLVRSAELLLHERVPRRIVLQRAQRARVDAALPAPELEQPAVREFDTAETPQPHVGLLGRLPYTILVSHCGAGYSRYEDLAVTRWRADGTTDSTGQFCYVKNVTEGRIWSAAHQPVCAPAQAYHALLATDRVTFQRSDGVIETRTDIAVVPEDSAEVRSVRVTNHGDATHEIELTSYGEIVLAPPDVDRAHRSFANLFVETEWHEWCTAITATRRPRSASERPLWCVHVVDTGTGRVGPVTCETDRARFLGRGRTTRDPLALRVDGALSGTTGAVLDPIFSLRSRLRLAPGESASVAFTTLVATTRARAFELADRYHDPHAAQRALDLAWTSQQVELRDLDLTPADAAVFQELAGNLLYSNPAVRASQDELRRNRGSQQLLWAQGISGEWPILLATIHSAHGLPTLRQVFAAHHYLRRRGMRVDLVVLNAQPSSYLQELQEGVTEALYASRDSELIDRPGGVFVRRWDQLSTDELLMLRATARVHLSCDGRPLGRILEQAAEQTDAAVDEARRARPRQREPRTARAVEPVAATPLSREPAPLMLAHGAGGLTSEGDYEVSVRGGDLPPAPWANVIANPHGGFVVTERGGGFTFAENSQFFRLTPWHNDPTSDPTSEVLYLRDENTGDLWSAMPAPIRRAIAYKVRHGAGASFFSHDHAGIAAHLTLGMAEDAAVKLSILRLTNHGDRTRRLTLTAYTEWTLGVLREHTQHQVHTAFDAGLGAILARNHFDPHFAGWVAFSALSHPVTGHTCDRREFLGRNGTAADPKALRATLGAGATGAGLDPCAALQCVVQLAPGETREIVILLGAAEGDAEATRLIAKYADPAPASAAVAAAIASWNERLSVIEVRTPEPSFDAMLNRWTLYQALACRMWARSALYQSSGAYGFRDQLQDVMAFVYAEPAIAREHILRAASRQFVEGDVQHWWHPHSGRGVRTRFSDDLVWLPYVVDHYVRVTADASVLDESAPFLTMRELAPDEHEIYHLPQVADERASVYEHCLRALRRASTAGAHGLPLIGTGDWNDGMNRVGVEGRGESLWLAWFLAATLRAFAAHAERRGDAPVASDLRASADAYREAVETHGWDGEWYRRAYYDDGTPLGSASNEECRIDSIAQSWSVISGEGEPGRQARAMQSLEQHLVREDARLIMLLTPPFDRTARDPGYIKGYVPGVRENGAQYTHAALWAALATALRGDGDRAFELFQMINPLTHARTPADIETYKAEPYVVAADVYTAEGQLGRGGWTWYTGSASWMYRVGLEAILGFRKHGDSLRIQPCTPADWRDFTIEYRFGSAVYVIDVREPDGIRRRGAEVTLDGRLLDDAAIPLLDDAARHQVVVRPCAR